MKEIDVGLIEKYGYEINAAGYISKGKRRLGSSPNTSGYLRVTLDVANKRSQFLVHRLIAAKYLQAVDGKQYVNHKDKNKLNNAASNLEYCTAAENMHHAYGVTERRREAKELHRSGLSYRAIAQVLGVSAVTVSNWVNDKDVAKEKRTQRELARCEGRLAYKGASTIIGR